MLNTQSNSIRIEDPFKLECGVLLPEIDVAFTTYGELNDDRSNAVIVLHALTGWPAAHEWWSGLIGNGKLLDPAKYFIIVPNLLGSCFGSTGPESIDPIKGKPYWASFPTITIRDMARVNLALLDVLGIENIHLTIGGSLGGMVVLEMAAIAPSRFRAIAPIAVSGQHSAWRIAHSSFIRKAIIAHDPSLQNKTKLADGLRLARQAAMISYRSSAEFDQRFGREKKERTFEVEHYLEHQGDKIAERFSPYSYLTLTRVMELYDLSEKRGSLAAVAASIECEAFFVGISSDLLYDPLEIEHFASLFPNGRYQTLKAQHGHDSFLVDAEALGNIFAPWLRDIEPHCEFSTNEYATLEEAAV
jgi:homoserine O-acetyltransferase/O-succinyltransferase